MALIASQRLSVKKHLGQHPHSTILDPLISVLEDGGAMEAELVAAVTLCDTTLSAKQAVEMDADELTEGDGAKFNYNRSLAIKKSAYQDAVRDLARLIGWPLPTAGDIVGFYTV